MKKTLKFTKEFEKIIQESTELAKSNNDVWVYPEYVMLKVAEKYCVDGVTPFDVEDSMLFLEIGMIPLMKIQEAVKKSLAIIRLSQPSGTSFRFSNDILTYSLPEKYFDPILSKILGGITKDEIGAGDFVREYLNCGILSPHIKKVFDEYKINLTDNTDPDEQKMFDNMSGFFDWLEKMSGGKMKMKKLDQDDLLKGFRMSLFDPEEDERSESDKLKDDDEIDQEIPFLSKYGKDMVKLAKSGKYDSMIGRDSELQELLEILSCRKKNNALLLGDPGTGKTSIIEGLAQKIAAGDVPINLLGKRIFNLDLNSLVAGTKYRGQYEERLQGVIKDVVNHKDIIVYIDEFHNLIGNGSSSGSGDGANILKPYLARGEFQCIGATTLSEYKKMVEKDGALKRRFQNVIVYQTSEEETVEILKKTKDKYEAFHGVHYSDKILEDCVSLSGRFITDRFFPDKAIDIMDMAGARAKLDSAASDPERLKETEEKLKDLQEKKMNAVKAQDFEGAAKYRDEEKNVKKQLDGEKSMSGKTEEVTLDTLSKVIEKVSGVPSKKVGQSDMSRLKDMKSVLEKVVIGQPEAIKDTVMSLQRNALGLRDPKKPIASLMMIGPTGSGKTYICKTIAKEFFGTEDALIRFDMSEFSEKHEITKLLGSTASYVGYDDEPLFEKVRNRPHCVVLFDEIEKAAKEIYQVFLNILDEGSITLGNGVKVNFQNAIIIFTGNIGTKELGIQKAGFGGSTQTKKDIEDITKKALKKTFSPEFINRLSKTIVFNKLTEDNLKEICGLEIKKLQDRVTKQGYELNVTPETIEKIVKECDTLYGARDLQRNIVKFIEEPVCDALLDNTTGKKISVNIDKVTIE